MQDAIYITLTYAQSADDYTDLVNQVGKTLYAANLQPYDIAVEVESEVIED